MRSGAYTGLLEGVMAAPGVRGALVVAVPDGLIVDGRVHVGIHGEAVAALSASLYRRVCGAGDSADGDAIRLLELEAREGRVVIAGDTELALMAVVERRANAGQVRLVVRRAAGELTPSTGSG